MVPISAAMAAPTRPATMRPASTGPSSRVSDTTTTLGMAAFGGEAGEAGVALQRQHHAGEDGGQADHGQRVVADLHHLPDDLLAVPRRLHGRSARPGRRTRVTAPMAAEEGERHAPEQR